MHYGQIKNCDIANGEGVRVSLFVSGCKNNCPHCFQPQTWDFLYGEPFTKAVEDSMIEMLRPEYIDGLTLLGGEPFEPQNQAALLPFVKRVRETYPHKSIWAFSGFTLEQLKDPACRANCEQTAALLALIDVLVDGRYEEEKKDISLRFRGSANQRIIDMQKTRAQGKLVLWDV